MKQRQFWMGLSAAILVVTGPGSVYGFTMLGPFDTWMNPGINYNVTDRGVLPSRNPRLNDAGGPQNLGEEYRRNVPVIYYAFDYAFLDYFGARGMQEVDAGIKILNDLPNFSSMSEDLSEYPLESQRINYRASSLGLLDLKSTALGAMLEQIGLLSPHEYAWTLRNKVLPGGQTCPFYDVVIIRRNFDPVTWEPTSYINGALYTFVYEWTCPPGTPDREDASEVPVDPLGFNWTAVASGLDQLNIGGFFDGLTRDDVGGLRYLYRRNNFNYEALPPDVSIGSAGGGSPWDPVDPNQTNALAVGASQVFAGMDRLQFVKVQYDSLLGQLFVPVTNNYSMTYITNSTQRTLGVSRAVAAPDIVFSAQDLVTGLNDVFVWTRNFPVYTKGSTLAAINGPGTITSAGGGNRISLNKVGPTLLGSYAPAAPFLSEATSSPTFRWGSFDGTTNPPVIYPSGISIKQMENLLFGGN